MPDEWYRRSKSRNVSSSSTLPSQDTIRRLAALQEDDEEEDEEEGTAKIGQAATPTHSPKSSGDWKGSMSQQRLSSMFDGWLGGNNRNSVVFSPENNRKSVSEPRLMERQPSLRPSDSDSDAGEESEVDENAFNDMMVGVQPRSCSVCN